MLTADNRLVDKVCPLTLAQFLQSFKTRSSFVVRASWLAAASAHYTSNTQRAVNQTQIFAHATACQTLGLNGQRVELAGRDQVYRTLCDVRVHQTIIQQPPDRHNSTFSS